MRVSSSPLAQAAGGTGMLAGQRPGERFEVTTSESPVRCGAPQPPPGPLSGAVPHAPKREWLPIPPCATRRRSCDRALGSARSSASNTFGWPLGSSRVEGSRANSSRLQRRPPSPCQRPHQLLEADPEPVERGRDNAGPADVVLCGQPSPALCRDSYSPASSPVPQPRTPRTLRRFLVTCCECIADSASPLTKTPADALGRAQSARKVRIRGRQEPPAGHIPVTRERAPSVTGGTGWHGPSAKAQVSGSSWHGAAPAETDLYPQR